MARCDRRRAAATPSARAGKIALAYARREREDVIARGSAERTMPRMSSRLAITESARSAQADESRVPTCRQDSDISTEDEADDGVVAALERAPSPVDGSPTGSRR